MKNSEIEQIGLMIMQMVEEAMLLQYLNPDREAFITIERDGEWFFISAKDGICYSPDELDKKYKDDSLKPENLDQLTKKPFKGWKKIK